MGLVERHILEHDGHGIFSLSAEIQLQAISTPLKQTVLLLLRAFHCLFVCSWEFISMVHGEALCGLTKIALRAQVCASLKLQKIHTMRNKKPTLAFCTHQRSCIRDQKGSS